MFQAVCLLSLVPPPSEKAHFMNSDYRVNRAMLLFSVVFHSRNDHFCALAEHSHLLTNIV